MAYSEKTIDHFENPRNVGSLDKSSKNVGTGIVGITFEGSHGLMNSWKNSTTA